MAERPGTPVLDRPQPIEQPQRQDNLMESLPILSQKDAIKRAISEKDRVIVVGQTGSGKTTMLPLFLNEVLAESRQDAKVLVTQPRRLAARSLARFVGQRVGQNIVGYRYRGENTVTDATKITFTVDGSLLNELRRDPMLSDYSAVMVDEVHERSIDIDIELALLKRSQEQRRSQGKPPLKVVLASATVDKEKLAAYFENSADFDIEGRLFEIADHFSDQEIDREDIMAEAANIASQVIADPNKTGDILIFMPGQAEIDKTIDELEARIHAENVEFIPLLGGEQDAASQDKIYADDGKRKIIVATNVAETSITVPNVKAVIDSGLMKMNLYDSNTGLTSLAVLEHTKSNWQQRRGRAGRVSAGDAYYLFTQDQLNGRQQFVSPEIQRTDLVALVLRMEEMGIEDVHGFDFIDHPSRESIDAALETLQKLGALDQNGAITDLGAEMAELQTDPHYARMLIEAKRRGCVEEVSVLVGNLASRRSVFAYNPRTERFGQKYADYLVENSDFLTRLKIWNDYVANNTSKEANIAWCQDKGFSRAALYEITRTKNELVSEESLRDLGISRQNKAADLANTDLVASIQKCVMAGLTDRLLIRSADGSYALASGRKTGIAIDRSSVLFGRNPEELVAGSIRTIDGGRTFANLGQVVENEWLVEVAPYLSVVSLPEAPQEDEEGERQTPLETPTPQQPQQQPESPSTPPPRQEPQTPRAAENPISIKNIFKKIGKAIASIAQGIKKAVGKVLSGIKKVFRRRG